MTAATPADVLRRATAYLERHGVESPRATAEVLLMHVLGTGRTGLYARREGLSTAEARAFGRALCQRCTGVPVQYITGQQRFMGLDLQVSPGVFVPRPETEVLVEAALEVIAEAERPTVVDVGTGTGAVALAIKQARPESTVVATDVSADAVDLARGNARRLGLEIEVMRGSLLEGLPEALQGRLDLLVSNPPYIAPEDYEALPAEVRAEPFEALVGGMDVHARLAELAPTWLHPGGWLAVEIGADQGPAVRRFFEGTLAEVEVLADLAGRDRVVRGRRP